ncbi:unnamed protein product [Symbiodinium sp. CCMP2592]|nr:unnamed protein product [Symbiodinium sp. CCMP2592]
MLNAYIARHRRDGRSQGEYSIIEVEYYRRPHYGRMNSRGPSGQKLTREARDAAFSSHCVEVDAPCCHPRLLVHKLRSAGLWDDNKYPMLALFVLHYAQWHKCLASYCDYTLDDAKVELIRIFYGGRPGIEAPFLLRLCDEVQHAAVALLRTPEASLFTDLYGDRPNPEFSRLSALLSFEEAKLLQIICTHLEDQVQVLIYDGCYIECNDLAREWDIIEACQICEKQMIPMDVKYWSAAHSELSTLPRMLVRENPSLWRIQDARSDHQPASCLHYAVGFLQPDCDIDLVAVTEDDSSISAEEFNDHMMYASQRTTSEGYRLIFDDDLDLTILKNSGQIRLCHQVQLHGGHWWGISFMSDARVMIVDSESYGRHLVTDFDVFLRLASVVQNMTWFRMEVQPHSWNHPSHEAYDLRGFGPHKKPALLSTSAGSSPTACMRTITTPLRHCAECGAPLQTERSIDDMDWVFVNSKTGFAKEFLNYHSSLQFRGGLSMHAILYAQKLYLNVLSVAEIMHEADSALDLMQHMHTFDVEDPLENNFMQDYEAWWRRNVCSKQEAAKMYEVVINGHEKVSSKCASSPPKHGGRPRADGTKKCRNNGWFMAVHPESGIIVGLREMIDPENNAIAVDVLNDVADMLPNMDCVIYDRMCSCVKAASKSDLLKGVKYWCIDKFHAHGHSDQCVCSPLVHRRLATRLREVNTSIAEQTFRWFRGYASTFNTMSRSTHLFYVLLYVQKHNDLVRSGSANYLNPYSTKRQIGLEAHILKKPVTKKYCCRKGSLSKKKPSSVKSSSSFKKPSSSRSKASSVESSSSLKKPSSSRRTKPSSSRRG